MKTTQNDMTVGDPMRIILSFTMARSLSVKYSSSFTTWPTPNHRRQIRWQHWRWRRLAGPVRDVYAVSWLCGRYDSGLYGIDGTEVWRGRYEGHAPYSGRCGDFVAGHGYC